jgi:hypothetical protein
VVVSILAADRADWRAIGRCGSGTEEQLVDPLRAELAVPLIVSNAGLLNGRA